MLPVFRLSEAAGALHLGVSFLACGALAAGLLAFGKVGIALGVGFGLVLHLTNTFFLYLSLTSLVRRDLPQRAPLVVGVSMVGRLLFLGFALWLIASRLGREVFLGAGGGLLVAQVSLLFRRFGAEGGE
jgi:hypothetical protein